MWELDIRNIAGIRSGDAEIYPGSNVVKAENWQGKSSFVAALQVAMGATAWDDEGHPLTDGASEGYVRLDTESDTLETKLMRNGDTVYREGEVYLTDEEDQVCARLFGFLGENNPIREAVRNESDLASLLTKPLDIENIDEQIARLKRERRSVETELERAEEAAERLTTVKSEIAELEEEIEELQTEREELAEQADTDGDSSERERLSNKRAEKEQLNSQINTLKNKIERQESRLNERQAELSELTVPAEPELTTDIEEKRDKIAELETNITLLEDLHRVNKRVLDEEKADLVTEIERTLSGDEIGCWVCGAKTSEAEISDRLGEISDTLEQFRKEKTDLQEEVSEIQDRRDEIRRQRQHKKDLENQIKELKIDLEANRSRLEELEARLEDVTEELARLRENVDETNSKVTDLKSDIKYRQNELEDKRNEVTKLEQDARHRQELKEEKEKLVAEIESLRTRRKEKKRELAERFEETMGDIVDTLDPGFEFARLAPKTDSEGKITEFDIVVARDGRETDLDALSQGEVEVLGIVTALAGYETFDVGDRLPILVLDGLTALSSANFRALVENVQNKADILVTTAYPEAGEFEGHVVDPYQWEVVSDQQASVS